jgi:hypothetical protein
MQLKVKNRKFAYAGSISKSAPGKKSGYFHYQKKRHRSGEFVLS